MSKNMTFVLVEWNDAHSYDDFATEEEMKLRHTPRKVHSIGLQFLRNAEGITLLRDYDDHGEGDGVLFIPRGMIVKVTRLYSGKA